MEEIAEAWRRIVAEKGGIIIGEPAVENGVRFVSIRCAGGHIWRPRVSHLVSSKSWCPECYGNKPHTIEDMHRIATARGGRCISTEYHGLRIALTWECMYEHQWDATPNNVKNCGSWCPHCKINVGEELVRAALEEAFPGHYFPRTRKEPWMQGLELDGFNKDLRLAFEYQGIQHSQQVDHFHRKDGAFEAQLERDQLTADRCLDEMVSLLTIPHIIKHKDIRQYVRRELEKLGWPFALEAIVKSDNEFYDSVRARGPSTEEQYARICAIAITKGGVCLSERYLGYRVPMHFRCGEGHEFDATPEAIDQPEYRGPRFCPECGGTRRKEDQELKDLVESCGYQFVSVTSRSVGGRTRRIIQVVCPAGHEIETLWDNFCPKDGKPRKGCAKCHHVNVGNSKRGDTTEWQRKHNLVLQGDYKNRTTSHVWLCENGHTFSGSYQCLKQKETPCTPCRLNVIAEESALELLTPWANQEGGATAKFHWKCNRCGNEFDMTIIAYGRRKHACPYCTE